MPLIALKIDLIVLEIDYRDLEDLNLENLDFEDLDLEITNNNTLLDSCLAKYQVLKDIASMIEFDIIWFSPLVNPITATIDKIFLTNMVNWEYRKIRDIWTRMPEVDHICWIINKRFGLSTRPC